MSNKVKISKSGLTIDVKAGLKREDIMKKYSTETVKLTNSDVTALLKQCGLKIRKFKRPNFEIIEDLTVPYNAIEVKKEAEMGNQLLVDELAK